jgi:hypothetical protein
MPQPRHLRQILAGQMNFLLHLHMNFSFFI